MKNTDIESFLRDNKPQVKDNPAFLLEVQQKMRAVEGIKSEVDRQRKFGHQALVIALLLGLVSGILVSLLAYLYPVDPETISKGIITDIRIFLDSWKQYLILPVAICAITLGLVVGRQRSMSI